MKKTLIIVDIDGTIANQDKRVHFLEQEKKDWESYFQACDKDTPIKPIVNLVLLLEENYDVVYCTGRTESVRIKTEDWLMKHVDNDDFTLLMRKDGDFRHDKDIKPELLREAKISLKSIAYVIEDRNSMVKTWRDLGLTVLDVAEGDF